MLKFPRLADMTRECDECGLVKPLTAYPRLQFCRRQGAKDVPEFGSRCVLCMTELNKSPEALEAENEKTRALLAEMYGITRWMRPRKGVEPIPRSVVKRLLAVRLAVRIDTPDGMGVSARQVLAGLVDFTVRPGEDAQ